MERLYEVSDNGIRITTHDKADFHRYEIFKDYVEASMLAINALTERVKELEKSNSGV